MACAVRRADLCADVALTPCANVRGDETPTCAEARSHTHDYVIGGRGPFSGAAPADEDMEGR
jgi:hypothetical protein